MLRRAAAQMRHDHPPGGDLGRYLWQSVGDELIGQAVKSVAAHALRVKVLRDGVVVRQRVVAAVECGVKAGDLGHVGKTGKHRADRRQVVRLV